MGREDGGGGQKSVLLRLDAELAQRMQAVAEIEGATVSEFIREAIAEHVERRRADPEFRRHVKETLERNRRLLEQLLDDEG